MRPMRTVSSIAEAPNVSIVQNEKFGIGLPVREKFPTKAAKSKCGLPVFPQLDRIDALCPKRPKAQRIVTLGETNTVPIGHQIAMVIVRYTQSKCGNEE